MSKRRLVVRAVAATILGAPLLLGAAEWLSQSAAAEGKTQTALATRSSPIAITHDDDYVWSVNPDNDSVSVFKVKDDENTKVAEIACGKRTMVRGHHARRRAGLCDEHGERNRVRDQHVPARK